MMRLSRKKVLAPRTVRLIVSAVLIAGVFVLLASSSPGLWMVFMMGSCTPRWTQIDEPNRVISDCEGLLNENGEIPTQRWPESIRKLGPSFVFVRGDHVEIILSSGGGLGKGWGYEVYPDKRLQSAHHDFHKIGKTVYPGIFQYETSPIDLSPVVH